MLKQLVEAGEVITRVVASVQAISPTETRISLRAQHTGGYVNVFTNFIQRGACTSTGVFERTLRDAAML